MPHLYYSILTTLSEAPHGCLRMTNWDVMRLSLIMKPGFRAKFVA